MLMKFVLALAAPKSRVKQHLLQILEIPEAENNVFISIMSNIGRLILDVNIALIYSIDLCTDTQTHTYAAV